MQVSNLWQPEAANYLLGSREFKKDAIDIKIK